MTLEEIAKYKKTLARKQKILKKYQQEIAELLKVCPHPHEERKPKKYYFSGSYDSKAYTEYWTECNLCKHRSGSVIEQHGWYG